MVTSTRSKKISLDRSAAKSELLKIDLLDFDHENPRFPPKIASGPTQLLLERFVRDERLQEIVESIGDHGFFPGEPLLVTKLPEGRFKVVEGNRRLAALKLLNGIVKAPEGRTSIAKAVEAAEHKPSKVPCLVFEAEDEVLRYLGFRHITGVKAWGALQKARYVDRLWKTYEALPRDEGIKRLARETGSRADYMGQMLCSLALYDKAESRNFFKLGLSPDDIEFSVLSTALSYTSIVDYLNLDSKADIDIKDLNEQNLKDLFQWLFVTIGNKKAIISESRNLRKLAAIVSSEAAVKELKSSGNLDDAYELSKGPQIALGEALKIAHKRLEIAWKLIPKVSTPGSDNIDLAEEILKIADIVKTALSTPPRTIKRVVRRTVKKVNKEE